MKRVPPLSQPCRDNSDANPPFPKVALATNGVVFDICGWPRQARRDNRMLPQYGIKPESAKRLYTAKRMKHQLTRLPRFRNLPRHRRGRYKNLLPICCLFLSKKRIKPKRMNQKADAVEPRMRANIGRISKAARQIMRQNPQCFGNFYERVHRGRFFSSFNTADEDRRKPGFFSQLFLTELGSLSLGANGVAQKTTVLRVDRHGRLGNRKRAASAMSLTTDYSCAHFEVGVKDIRFRWQTN